MNFDRVAVFASKRIFQIIRTMLIAASLTTTGTARAEDAARFLANKAGLNIISVTRKNSNEYEFLGRSMIIKTKYCYEYVYYEDAVIVDKILVFLEENETCDIDAIYRKD